MKKMKKETQPGTCVLRGMLLVFGVWWMLFAEAVFPQVTGCKTAAAMEEEVKADEREAFVPDLTGCRVSGLDGAIEFTAGTYHYFFVEGVSASDTYDELVPGDGRWVPAYWSMKKDASSGETLWRIRSLSGIYNREASYTIYIYYRLYIWDGEEWRFSGTTSYLPYYFRAARITPTPSPLPEQPPTGMPESPITNTPVPTPTDTPAAVVTDTPTPTPTKTPTPKPTKTPTPRPTKTPTPKPTKTPTPKPTAVPVKLSLNKKSTSLYLVTDKTFSCFTLKPKMTGVSSVSFQYKSKNKNVAKVTGKGVIQAVGRGTTDVTVTAKGTVKGKTVTRTAVFHVKVKKPSLKLGKTSFSVSVGKKISVKKYVSAVPAAAVTYKSKNTRIAKVNKNGTIAGVKKGKTTVTIQANGLIRKITVTVK